MSVKERIKFFLEYKELSQSAFEKRCGLSNGYVNNIRKSISDNILQKVALTFPELNPVWLRMGEGKMLLNEEVADVKKNNSPRVLTDMSVEYMTLPVEIFKLIQTQAETILSQQRIIEERFSSRKDAN
ncbi:MAG: helix-turn-helix transcriptional regulator [Bacteroidales bacterium]|jgi:transcriptional regulator with XRE-family HTH domain